MILYSGTIGSTDRASSSLSSPRNRFSYSSHRLAASVHLLVIIYVKHYYLYSCTHIVLVGETE